MFSFTNIIKMASSSAAACIQSVLDDLKLLRGRHQLGRSLYLRELFCGMRLLRTFILCARKLTNHDTGEDASLLVSFLVTVEDVVSKNAEELHSYRLAWEHGLANQIRYDLKNFLNDIKTLADDVDEWFIRLSDSSRFSSFLMVSQVVEIMDSLGESLVEFQSWMDSDKELRIVQALKETMSFFQNFIRFFTMRCVENREMQDLLAHIEVFSINAARLVARLFYKNIYERHSTKMSEDIWSEIKVLLQPSDPGIYKTYAQALRKVRTPPNMGANDDPVNIMKDFLDSLSWNLWEMLLLESSLVFFEKDPVQLLYEGLRLLMTILKDKANKLDDKIQRLIGVVICDAGVIIFSLSQQETKVDLELQDLLERIKTIWADVEDTVPGTSTVIFPNPIELGFMDILLESLVQLTSSKVDSAFQSHVQIIREELVFLRSFLGEIVGLRDRQAELQTLWNRVTEMAHKLEFLIDHLVHGDASDSLATSFDSIAKDIRIIKDDADALKIFYDERRDIKLKKAATASSHLPSQMSAPTRDGVVGFDKEATWIIERLTRGSKEMKIVAVVGMPGSGKTTLATKVYNDPKVTLYFHVHAFCTISQVFDKRKVLLELLKPISTKDPSAYLKMSEDDLAQELRRCLKQRPYIILLDDIWDIKAWNSLGASFPNDSNGSRILLTSRVRDAALHTLLDQEPLFLRELTNDESWELLQKKLFPENACPPELCELGMEIAKQCKGLPLTIVIVAGLLATIEQKSWKGVLESINSGIVTSTEQCMNALELSYRHLPDYLKPCFLYFGAFPEDEEIPFRRLIRLWIAEGFVKKSELKSLEDVAKGQLTNLIGRSLVLVAQRGSLGGVKACRVHDLLRDFCLTKSKQENFFQLLKGYDDLLAFHDPSYMRRLSINSERRHFVYSRIFCPRVRSLLFFAQTRMHTQSWFDISFVIHLFKLLRVLDIGQIPIGPVFPSEVGLLVQLRYLAVSGYLEVIPSTIGNLSNLETFIVHSRSEVILPETLWNLQKLRHIGVRGFKMPVYNLEKYSNLYEVDSISGVMLVTHRVEEQLRKFPNIRKLTCLLNWEYGSKQIFVPEFLTRLESLFMEASNGLLDETVSLGVFPPNLRKLTLFLFQLEWNEMSVIGKLPNLEVLKLCDVYFVGDTWDMEEEGGFSKLRFLKLQNMVFVWWKSSDDQFPNLQKLWLDHCPNLEELPCCLENIATLEMIEVRDCPKCIESSVKNIQQVQMEYGNSDLKILIQS